MGDGFFGTQARVGADLQFDEFFFAGQVRFAEQRAEDCADKSDGNAEHPGIFERENGRVLDHVTGRGRDGGPDRKGLGSAGDALEGVGLDETEQVACHPPHLDFLGSLGDAVPAVVAVDVLERHVP